MANGSAQGQKQIVCKEKICLNIKILDKYYSCLTCFYFGFFISSIRFSIPSPFCGDQTVTCFSLICLIAILLTIISLKVLVQERKLFLNSVHLHIICILIMVHADLGWALLMKLFSFSFLQQKFHSFITIQLFRKLRIIYLPTFSKSVRHEICILGALGFLKTRSYPKTSGDPRGCSKDFQKYFKHISRLQSQDRFCQT
jgi:hypothetical protein